jgi:hypothetical protein
MTLLKYETVAPAASIYIMSKSDIKAISINKCVRGFCSHGNFSHTNLTMVMLPPHKIAVLMSEGKRILKNV